MLRPTDHDQARAAAAAWRLRLAAALLFAALAAAVGTALALGWHNELSLEALVRHRAAIETLVAAHPAAAVAAYVGFYAVAAGCSLPGVVFLTIGGGAVFGALAGGFAAVAGATAGATWVFLLVRSLIASGLFGGAMARRAGALASRFAGGFRDDAFNYLLFMRLVPLFPFWLVNVVPALCGVRLRTYVAATALGVVPGTLAFALFGAGLDSALETQTTLYRACLAAGGTACRLGFDARMVLTPQLIAGLVALGLAALVPVAIKRFTAGRGG